MTPQQVNIMLETIGVPVAYYQFKEGTGQQPPFVCFFYGNSNDVIADNSNYLRVDRLFVELYTDEKDFALEKSVETTLNNYGIVFDKSEEYIDSERMHVTVYQSDVVLEV